ncbi:DUF1768-domain-containing protein [Mycena filopes]|nr:DUF1768-domain-containing protein [Mycena filopes]
MNYYNPATNMPPAKCVYCHIYPKKWDGTKYRYHAYCSKACADHALGRTQDNTNNQVPVIPDTKNAPGDCDQCHALPRRWDDQTQQYDPYCSKTCAQAAKRLQLIQMAPSVSNNCIHCGVKPRYGNQPYCGKTCAQAAAQPTSPIAVSNLCIQCGVRPKDNGHAYCGRNCVQAARRSPAQTRAQARTRAPPPFSPISPRGTRPRILFYDHADPYYGFTNFSAHSVIYKGKEYPTSEHLYQAFKFLSRRPDIAEEIRTISTSPRKAFEKARVYKAEQHPNWLNMNIEKMDVVLWHKFTQHEDLKRELLGTGDAELVENSVIDPFWGIGKNHQGRNELGKALERLRTQLRTA